MLPLILWGGTDINPNIYNEDPLIWTQKPDNPRDDKELYLIDMAVENKQPIVGVCRGAQLLCAYNGGNLYQHVEIPGMATAHVTGSDGQVRRALVDHHQVMILPKKDVSLLGWQITKPVKAYKTNTEYDLITLIPQVAYFPKINALAIQPHPEWMQQTDPFVIWINNICSNLLGVKENVF